MQHHVMLHEEERDRRVTVSDAIDILANNAAFGDDNFAEIRVGGMRLPSGDVVGLPNLFFSSYATLETLVVSIATSARFSAKRKGDSDARPLCIFKLDGAKVANDGSVRLSDGTLLRAVEVIPARLPSPSELGNAVHLRTHAIGYVSFASSDGGQATSGIPRSTDSIRTARLVRFVPKTVVSVSTIRSPQTDPTSRAVL